MSDRTRRFRVTAETGPKRRIFVPLPFDPDGEWGSKSTHHVAGTMNGHRFRAVIEIVGSMPGVVLGCDRGIAPGDEVDVTIAAEGPQRDDLADDFAAALRADPSAGAFFDSLATFYRKGYVRWIEATKRRPDVRAARIAETVELLRTGNKERPRP